MPKSRESDAVIAVVDDDLSAREGLSSLIRSAGWQVEVFASAQEFLARPCAQAPGCLVLDLQLPGLSGLDLQKRMVQAGLEIPIVFLTGHGNIPASVQAMKAGAVEFLTKPFDEQELFMQQVVSGLLNKQIAAELNITEFTVKIHRGHVMRKMRADSVADLVRMAENLAIRSLKRSNHA
jgi:FixJ family two-component response regulator